VSLIEGGVVRISLICKGKRFAGASWGEKSRRQETNYGKDHQRFQGRRKKKNEVALGVLLGKREIFRPPIATSRRAGAGGEKKGEGGERKVLRQIIKVLHILKKEKKKLDLLRKAKYWAEEGRIGRRQKESRLKEEDHQKNSKESICARAFRNEGKSGSKRKAGTRFVKRRRGVVSIS